MEQHTGDRATTHIFVPATTSYQGIMKEALARMTIASVQDPDRGCGLARRIGYVDRDDFGDVALYRLKLHKADSERYTTLPELFVFVERHFVQYDEWLQHISSRKEQKKIVLQ